MTAETRRRGRPLQGTEPKIAPLPCRTSLRLRERVEAAARKNKRSISCEIESRLYFSFDAEDDARLRALAKAAMSTQEGNDNGNR